MSIADNLRRVNEQIDNACARADRDPSDVQLLAVSKTFPVEAIAEAAASGQLHFGENRVQEGLAKLDQLPRLGVEAEVHLIGHLQRNKARHAGRFATVQSVDSVRLAQAVSSRLESDLTVMLEVNVAEEPSKHGFKLEEVRDALTSIQLFSNLRVVGLMTVAPQVEDPEHVRPVFRKLRALAEELTLSELSMGMSNDYAVAIQEGSTMVRVGRAIFGQRETHAGGPA